MGMQASDAYDLEAHVRGTQKAMSWCHEFAEGHAAIGAAVPKQAIVVKAVALEQPVSNGLVDERTQKKPCRRPVGHLGREDEHYKLPRLEVGRVRYRFHFIN